MTLVEIENLTAAELKSRKAELIEQAKKAKVDELAARYVQARTDATIRDEKLHEQGVTITSLNEALLSEKNLSASLRSEISKVVGDFNDLNAINKQSKADIEELKGGLFVATSLAKRRRGALADVMALANQLNTKIAPLLTEES